MTKLIVETLVVGIAIMIVGLPISYLGMKISGEEKIPPAKAWISIALSLFLTGAITHLLFAVAGANK